MLAPFVAKPGLHGPGTGAGYAGQPLPKPRTLTPGQRLAVRVIGGVVFVAIMALLLMILAGAS